MQQAAHSLLYFANDTPQNKSEIPSAFGGIFLSLFAYGNKHQQRNVRGLRNLPYRRLIADDLDVHGVAVHHGVQDVLGGVLQAVEGDTVLCLFVLASIVFSISVSIRLKRRSI